MLCTRPNQVYSGCGDNGCQRRCDRLDVAGCVPICSSPSCICVDGFVRNSIGECVPVSSCRKWLLKNNCIDAYNFNYLFYFQRLQHAQDLIKYILDVETMDANVDVIDWL